MIVPDINLLLYAYDADSPFHPKAAAWWQDCLSGAEPVLLPDAVIFGFVRVGTNPRVFRHPLTVAEATSHVRAWLGQEVVSVPESTPDHVERVLGLLEALGTAGNLVTDAQIAAVALENDATVNTADADFIRFKGLRWRNPLNATGSGHRIGRRRT